MQRETHYPDSILRAQNRPPISMFLILGGAGIALVTSALGLVLILTSLGSGRSTHLQDVRPLATSIFTLSVSQGLIRKRRWAWTLAVVGGGVGTLITALEIIAGVAAYPFAWVVFGAFTTLFLALHRRFFYSGKSA